MVIKYSINIIKFTILLLLCMGISDGMELINFNWVNYLLVCSLPSISMIIWLVIEYVKFKINGE